MIEFLKRGSLLYNPVQFSQPPAPGCEPDPWEDSDDEGLGMSPALSYVVICLSGGISAHVFTRQDGSHIVANRAFFVVARELLFARLRGMGFWEAAVTLSPSTMVLTLTSVEPNRFQALLDEFFASPESEAFEAAKDEAIRHYKGRFGEGAFRARYKLLEQTEIRKGFSLDAFSGDLNSLGYAEFVEQWPLLVSPENCFVHLFGDFEANAGEFAGAIVPMGTGTRIALAPVRTACSLAGPVYTTMPSTGTASALALHWGIDGSGLVVLGNGEGSSCVDSANPAGPISFAELAVLLELLNYLRFNGRADIGLDAFEASISWLGDGSANCMPTDMGEFPDSEILRCVDEVRSHWSAVARRDPVQYLARYASRAACGVDQAALDASLSEVSPSALRTKLLGLLSSARESQVVLCPTEWGPAHV